MTHVWSNAALLIVNNTRTVMHAHYALEIYIGLNASFQMDTGAGFKSYHCLAVNSNVPHRFSGEEGSCALILIHPGTHRTSQMILTLLNGSPVRDLGKPGWRDLPADVGPGAAFTCDTALKWVRDRLETLNRNSTAATVRSSRTMDPRITQSCHYIRQSYKEPVRLSDLASNVHLSESRFRHLFKQETGITIRQFILNTRTAEAVKLIIRGYSKTYAAHEAGFSDSAHLSRTFKRMYGLVLSDLYGAKQRNTFHLCPGTV